jgi:hypothetical protein
MILTQTEVNMGRFYLHIREGDTLHVDDEGIELAGVDAAKEEALLSARQLLSDAIRHGRPSVPEAIIIADESGREVEVLPIAAALPEPLKQLVPAVPASSPTADSDDG